MQQVRVTALAIILAAAPSSNDAAWAATSRDAQQRRVATRQDEIPRQRSRSATGSVEDGISTARVGPAKRTGPNHSASCTGNG